ncbi:MAG TPA: hypothetical protein VFL57_15480 [Bryobacteraceae bacterium]|nr:hypothetical protein [Bryobacteraceae bacterium]
MVFRATNFTVIILLLLAFTVFMMGVRNRKPLENNWPLVYWVLMLSFTYVRPEETFNLVIVGAGLAAGLMLRFEFMNSFFIKTVKYIEMAIWCYVLVRGADIVIG